MQNVKRAMKLKMKYKIDLESAKYKGRCSWYKQNVEFYVFVAIPLKPHYAIQRQLQVYTYTVTCCQQKNWILYVLECQIKMAERRPTGVLAPGDCRRDFKVSLGQLLRSSFNKIQLSKTTLTRNISSKSVCTHRCKYL